MKKWLFLYLIFNFLAAAMPISLTISLLKLGNLASHYHDHGNHEHDTNIFSFIVSHYLDKKDHNADHDDHEKLPFHNAQGEGMNITPQAPFVLPQLSSDLCCSKMIIQDTLVNDYSQHFPAASFPEDIWQPPKHST